VRADLQAGQRMKGCMKKEGAVLAMKSRVGGGRKWYSPVGWWCPICIQVFE